MRSSTRTSISGLGSPRGGASPGAAAHRPHGSPSRFRATGRSFSQRKRSHGTAISYQLYSTARTWSNIPSGCSHTPATGRPYRGSRRGGLSGEAAEPIEPPTIRVCLHVRRERPRCRVQSTHQSISTSIQASTEQRPLKADAPPAPPRRQPPRLLAARPHRRAVRRLLVRPDAHDGGRAGAARAAADWARRREGPGGGRDPRRAARGCSWRRARCRRSSASPSPASSAARRPCSRCSASPRPRTPVAAHGGVRTLFEICRTPGDSVSQSATAGVLRNLSTVPEAHHGELGDRSIHPDTAASPGRKGLRSGAQLKAGHAVP